MTKRNSFKVIIGRDTGVDFPDMELSNVAARIDTGAYRSAIHARNIKEKNGELTFEILSGHPVFGAFARTCHTKKFTNVRIENSFGHAQRRYEVRLKVKVGPKVFTAPFSLADRSKKRYPILIGRTLLNDRFIIDTAQSNLDRNDLKKHGIEMPMDEEQEHS